jgi:hypothetical protein
MSSMEYNVISLFSITNKTPTNKQIDWLLQNIFINRLGEISNYRVSILNVFRHIISCAPPNEEKRMFYLFFSIS